MSGDRRRWFALAVVMMATFMDLVDVTIVNVAIPSLQKSIGASFTAVQWITEGYALAFAIGLITGGRLGDIYGRKRMFLLGIAGFTLASAFCGFAANPNMLIAGRVLQGATAALMVPQVLAIIHVTFPAHERGKVFGMFGAVIGLGAVSGPLIGALLTQWNLFGLEWRPIFLVNLPIGLLGLYLGNRYITESRAPHALRLDLIGMALASAGLLMLLFPLTHGREYDWPWWCFALMVASVPVLLGFVRYEQYKTAKDGSPLIELSLFRWKSFAAGIDVEVLFGVVMGMFFLVWTLYMQLGMGWSPLRAGLTGVPFSLALAFTAAISVQKLVPKFGRKVIQAGALIMLSGMLFYLWTVNRYGTTITSADMIPPLMVMGAGMGLIVAPLTDAVLSEVPKEHSGSASGLINTTQQLGLAIGLGLISVVFFGAMSGQAGSNLGEVEGKLRSSLAAESIPPGQIDEIAANFRICAMDRAGESDPAHVPASCEPAPGEPQDPAVEQALSKAGAELNGLMFAGSFGNALKWAIGVLVAIVLLMFALPRMPKHHEPDEIYDHEDTEAPAQN